jgi:hypothetical protein
MNEPLYRYEFDTPALDYLLKILGMRPHDEVRGMIDHLLRGRMEQDQERRAAEQQSPAPGHTAPWNNGQQHPGVPT